MYAFIQSICFFLVARVALSSAIGNSSTHAVSLVGRDGSASFSAASGPSWYENGSPFLTLDNGVLFFFQGDGNIVVHQENTNTVFWASGSTGQTCDNGRCKLQFQTDGNLVAVDYGVNPPHPFWSTGTQSYDGHPTAASQLVFRNTAPWIQLLSSSGFTEWETSGTSESLMVSNDAQAVVDAAWGPFWAQRDDPFLALGDVLFFAQGDGNIVVHQRGTDTVYWSSGSVGHDCGGGRCHLQFQNDGNLVYVDYGTNPPTPFWSTGSTGGPNQAVRMFFRSTPPYIQLLDANGNNAWETVGPSQAKIGPIDDHPPFKDPGSAPPYPKPDPCGSVPCFRCYGDCEPGPPFSPSLPPGGETGDCTSDFRRSLVGRGVAAITPLVGKRAASSLLRRFDDC